MSNPIWAPVSGDTVWSTAANWSTSSVPVSTDNAYLQNITTDILTGLAQSAVTLASLTQYVNFNGKVGTPTTYLNIGATVFNLGVSAPGGGSNSQRLNINAANSGAIINIYDGNSSPFDNGYAPIRLLGTALVISAVGGTYCVALAPGETASVATLSQTLGSGSTPIGTLGAGVTLTTGNILAGTVNNYSTAASTITLSGSGSLNHYGSGGYTALTVNKGCSCSYVGTGTITQLDVTGSLDLSQGTGAVTVTNCNIYNGGSINDTGNRLTFTNPLKAVECTLEDITLILGYNKHYQVS